MRWVALAAAALTLGLAACGGGDGEAEPEEPAATTTPPAETGAPAETTGPSTSDRPGADGQPAIIVESPRPDDAVTSPVTVAGTADVFEANVTVLVLDASGAELARDFTTATCGTGCRGDFSIDLPFEVAGEQEGTVVVQDDDAAGTGTPPNVVEIPVTLQPS